MGRVLIKTPIRWWVALCALVLSINAFAQDLSVKGNVIDETGEPVIGATVRVAGTNNGTATDYDGNFTLNAKQGQNIIVTILDIRRQP